MMIYGLEGSIHCHPNEATQQIKFFRHYSPNLITKNGKKTTDKQRNFVYVYHFFFGENERRNITIP